MVYSWRSFEIGWMYFKLRREREAFFCGGLGISAAIIYFSWWVTLGSGLESSGWVPAWC